MELELLGTTTRFDAVGWKHSKGTAGAPVPAGEALELVRDPANGFDPNAVQVRHPNGGALIGFLASAAAAQVAPLLDAGLSVNAVCTGFAQSPQRHGLALTFHARADTSLELRSAVARLCAPPPPPPPPADQPCDLGYVSGPPPGELPEDWADRCSPSRYRDNPAVSWVGAHAPQPRQPAAASADDYVRCGKWLFYVSQQGHDAAWKAVVVELCGGRLGGAQRAKASPPQGATGVSVVIVHVSDFLDAALVERVGLALSALFPRVELLFKADIQTNQREYAGTNGGEQISLFRIRKGSRTVERCATEVKVQSLAEAARKFAREQAALLGEARAAAAAGGGGGWGGGGGAAAAGAAAAASGGGRGGCGRGATALAAAAFVPFSGASRRLDGDAGDGGGAGGDAGGGRAGAAKPAAADDVIVLSDSDDGGGCGPPPAAAAAAAAAAAGRSAAARAARLLVLGPAAAAATAGTAAPGATPPVAPLAPLSLLAIWAGVGLLPLAAWLAGVGGGGGGGNGCLPFPSAAAAPPASCAEQRVGMARACAAELGAARGSGGGGEGRKRGRG